jgi:predicted DNA-binding transcriptional regulator AlpA
MKSDKHDQGNDGLQQILGSIGKAIEEWISRTIDQKIRDVFAAALNAPGTSGPNVPANDGQSQLLTIDEVAKRTGKSPSVLYYRMSIGEFPKPTKDGYRSFWPSDKVDQWKARAGNGASEARN